MNLSKNVRGSRGWLTFLQSPSLVAAELLTCESKESESMGRSPSVREKCFMHLVIELGSPVIFNSVLQRGNGENSDEWQHSDLRCRRSEDGEDYEGSALPVRTTPDTPGQGSATYFGG